MPYKDPAKQREYQRQWMASQRAMFLEDKCCVDCGSTELLEIDHIRGEKVEHRIWSWTPSKRNMELSKCVVRCRACHTQRHADERRVEHGAAGYRKRNCRCAVCREAKAEANRRYRESRARRDSNARPRLCRPAHNHSATGPGEQLNLLDKAA